MKQRIRLTESDIHRIVKESVKRILKEGHGLDNYRVSEKEVDDFVYKNYLNGFRDRHAFFEYGKNNMARFCFPEDQIITPWLKRTVIGDWEGYELPNGEVIDCEEFEYTY